MLIQHIPTAQSSTTSVNLGNERHEPGYTSPSKMKPISFWMRCSDRTLFILRLVNQHQQRLIQAAILTVFTILGFTAIYLMLFTPTPVYILDRLNLRPFFLPNIMCDGCNNFTFKYLMNNKSACTDQEEVSLIIFMLRIISCCIFHLQHLFSKTN